MLAEITHYLGRIDDLRGQMADLVRHLPAEALNWRPVPGGEHETNSLAVLAAHAAGAEQFWVGEVIGRQPATRQREDEFLTRVDDSSELLANFARNEVQTRRVLAPLTAVDLEESRQVRGKTVPVRWGILHVIDHTSLHLGHMQITYQLFHHGRGKDAPRWFQRVPD